MPNIYIYCLDDEFGKVAYAVAEDGTGLAAHLSSNKLYVRHDMGINSRWKHDYYSSHYPEGYTLMDYTDLEPDQFKDHPDLMKAITLNHEIQGPSDDASPSGQDFR